MDIKVDDHFLRPYEYGWELHQAYLGYKKKGSKRVSCTRHRLSYWPTLKHACIGLLDTLNRESAGAADIVSEINRNTDRIISAIGGNDDNCD